MISDIQGKIRIDGVIQPPGEDPRAILCVRVTRPFFQRPFSDFGRAGSGLRQFLAVSCFYIYTPPCAHLAERYRCTLYFGSSTVIQSLGMYKGMYLSPTPAYNKLRSLYLLMGQYVLS